MIIQIIKNQACFCFTDITTRYDKTSFISLLLFFLKKYTVKLVHFNENAYKIVLRGNQLMEWLVLITIKIIDMFAD